MKNNEKKKQHEKTQKLEKKPCKKCGKQQQQPFF